MGLTQALAGAGPEGITIGVVDEFWALLLLLLVLPLPLLLIAFVLLLQTHWIAIVKQQKDCETDHHVHLCIHRELIKRETSQKFPVLTGSCGNRLS